VIPENPLEVLEEAGVGFDPTSQYLDLSKDEKRRTTALFLAINAYRELIIKEADYLREVNALARSGEGPHLQTATIDAMIVAAGKFDRFIEDATVTDPLDEAQAAVAKAKGAAP
jgi:hypothetical protein